MATVVYILCTLAALTCSLMLFRGYVRTKTRLLLWGSLCFMGLSLNNFLVVCDLVLFPDVYLLPYRNGAAVLAMGLMLFGLIWDAD